VDIVPVRVCPPLGQELTRDERTQKLHLVRNAWMAVVHISLGQLVYNRSDPRSDLFALGVLMHFFATGQRPFGDPVKVGERRCRLRPHSAADGPRRHSTMVSRTQLAPPTDAKARPAPAGEPAFDLQHPDAIVLTERSASRARLAVHGGDPLLPCGSGPAAVRADPFASACPGAHAMAAVDLSRGTEALAEALRLMVRRILQTEQSARLACLNVLKWRRSSGRIRDCNPWSARR
jgi:hypothetical protein